jgi:hypothetical protein
MRCPYFRSGSPSYARTVRRKGARAGPAARLHGALNVAIITGTGFFKARAAPRNKETATMWYFSWTPAIGVIDAMRQDAIGHDDVARRNNAGKRRS